MAVQTLEDFVAKWKTKYRKIMESLDSIYSTNFMESLNKEIKRQTQKKILFPNEVVLERYLVTLFEDYNFKQSQ